MNSLRLVLGAWLLALLAGLQAGVGLLAYSNARLVVMEKNVTAEELELSRTEDRKHEEMEHMDRQLLDHALILARLMQVHLNWNRIRYREFQRAVEELAKIKVRVGGACSGAGATASPKRTLFDSLFL